MFGKLNNWCNPNFWFAQGLGKTSSASVRRVFADLCAEVGKTLAKIINLTVDILPEALVFLGLVIAVFFGVRFIKKVMR